MNTDRKPIAKPQDLLHLGHVNLNNIPELVHKLPSQLWEAETARRENDYFCFNDTEHILFMFANGENHESYIEKPLWNFWKPKLMPLINEAIKPYNYANGKVVKAMLAKLNAGGKIDKHKDFIIRDQYVHKIHIPLISNPKAIMLIEDQQFHLEVGQAYEVNNLVYHAVNNDGAQDRIHFIFEYYNQEKITSI